MTPPAGREGPYTLNARGNVYGPEMRGDGIIRVDDNAALRDILNTAWLAGLAAERERGKAVVATAKELAAFVEEQFRRSLFMAPKREKDAEVAKHMLLAPFRAAILKYGADHE